MAPYANTVALNPSIIPSNKDFVVFVYISCWEVFLSKTLSKKNCCSFIWLFFLLVSPETDNELLFITFTASTLLNSNSFWFKGRTRIAIVIDDCWVFLLLLLTKLFFWNVGSVIKGLLFKFWLSSINYNFIK